METPIGTLEVDVRDGALVALRFARGKARAGDAPPPDRVRSALEAYFDGDVHAISDLPVDLAGTPFGEAVLKALRDVPAGETATYGEIARRIGAPRAVRAVGTAVGRNPVAIVVPCHRIVPSTGGIGNYGAGAERKAWLLAHERAHA